ncbi:MAG: tRNA1(Val) (adenine(37)-N6)-methyltransferase [Eubacterium sp.]|nr:tRNA1(Val) (adenine(37)-N6)-methyltransferase [Eubacterium sp.]
MKVELKENESLCDLQRNGYQIIQDKDRFCFGMDAVLLSGFAEVRPGESVVDFGTGTGILPILLEAKTDGEKFVGLEIQSDSVDMAKRSVQYNDLEDKVEIVEGDIKEASKIFGKANYDVVVTNPPYMSENNGLENPDEPKAIARHEIKCTLEDVIRESAAVLKPQGRFYMVHRPRRLADAMELMRDYKIEPKRIRMVYPYADKPANMVLIEGTRGGKPMLNIEEPLIVYSEPNVYTREIIDIYEK